MCSDGSFCPNIDNVTCCFNNNGVKQIEYNNSAFIPTAATDIPSHYFIGGYTIPTTTRTNGTLDPTEATALVGNYSVSDFTVPTMTGKNTDNVSSGASWTTSSVARPTATVSGTHPVTTGLSVGAKAAIVVSILRRAIILSLIVLGPLRLNRKRRQRKRPVTCTNEQQTEVAWETPQEHATYEMDGIPPIQEIESSEMAHEPHTHNAR